LWIQRTPKSAKAEIEGIVDSAHLEIGKAEKL